MSISLATFIRQLEANCGVVLSGAAKAAKMLGHDLATSQIVTGAEHAASVAGKVIAVAAPVVSAIVPAAAPVVAVAEGATEVVQEVGDVLSGNNTDQAVAALQAGLKSIEQAFMHLLGK